jgi:hypothetical protein
MTGGDLTRWARLLFLAANAQATTGCSEGDACPGVVNGATYDLAVGTPASGKDPADCNQEWGIADGSTFTARVKELQGDGACRAGVPEIENLDGWTLSEQHTEARGDALLEGTYVGTFGSCSGLVLLKLSAEDGLPCDGSATTECLLMLHFQPQSSGCPEPCRALLTTTVTRR